MSRGLALLGLVGVAATAGFVASAISADHKGRFLKRLKVRLTRYWPATLREGPLPLMSRDNVPLAWVTADSLVDLRMEGTGVLPDGRRVNYLDGIHWQLVPAGVHGYGVGGRELVPFESIAVDPSVIPLDSLCYLVELRRWVKAVDVGDLIKGLHIDLFVPGAAAASGDDARDFCTVDVYA